MQHQPSRSDRGSMSLLNRLLFAVLAFSVLTAPLAAQRGKVHVRGYTRHDGTYVAPHTRSAPRSYAAPTPRLRSYSSRPRSYTVPRTYAAPKAQRTPSARPYRAPSARSRSYVSPDGRSRTHRSRSARDDFMRRTGHPRGRPGYVVDHLVPLCAGGADAPGNMQWQTVQDAKVKDRQERAECAGRRH